ncbi:hypothetical protein D3C86_2169250 [compost metagenome]
MQNINWFTLILSLLGALKLILQPFGVEIPDDNFNEIANGAAGLAALIGIFLSHKKVEVPNVITQPTTFIDNNK